MIHIKLAASLYHSYNIIQLKLNLSVYFLYSIFNTCELKNYIFCDFKVLFVTNKWFIKHDIVNMKINKERWIYFSMGKQHHLPNNLLKLIITPLFFSCNIYQKIKII